MLTMKDLTLEKALQEAVSCELATKGVEALQNKKDGLNGTAASSVSLVRDDGKMCFRCNRKGHVPSKCRFVDAVCLQCNKKGHIRPACNERTSKKSCTKKQQQNKKKNSSNASRDEQVRIVRLN